MVLATLSMKICRTAVELEVNGSSTHSRTSQWKLVVVILMFWPSYPQQRSSRYQPEIGCIRNRSERSDVPLVSIIPGTGAAIWSKTNFPSTGHHHPRSHALPHVCTVPSASASFKCILEVVSCEGAQHRLRFCLDPATIISIVSKRRPFSFITNRGKIEKSQGTKSGE
jgi:hypothetical protein